ESHLAASLNLRRQQIGKRTTEQDLGRAAAQLVPVGEAGGELDDSRIQERRTRLQRVRHAGPVHLDQQVERQIGVKIVCERDRERREAVCVSEKAAVKIEHTRKVYRARDVGLQHLVE